MPFEWKAQHDYDLHIALEVEPPVLDEMLAKGKARGIETRGISEHGFVRSIYFRDPNGYVIELTAKTPEHARMMDPATNDARAILDRWQAEKTHAPLSRPMLRKETEPSAQVLPDGLGHIENPCGFA